MPSSHKTSVLIVDASPDSETVVAELRGLGLWAARAAEAGEARRLLRALRFDAVVVDLDADGAEAEVLLADIARDQPATVRIVATTRPSPMAEGRVVAKPLAVDALVRCFG